MDIDTILIILGCLGSFFAAFFFTHIIDCWSRPFEARRQATLDETKISNKDMRQRVINALFPSKQYEQGEVVVSEVDDGDKPAELEPCPICIEHFKENDVVSEGHQCAHQYHRVCLLEWATKHNDCPVCRMALWKEEDYLTAKEKLPPPPKRAKTANPTPQQDAEPAGMELQTAITQPEVGLDVA